MAGKILVTGATGNVSSGLIPNLTAKGASVRALVRDPSKAQGLRDAGVEVVTGDFDKAETLDGAFSGVDKVFLVTAPNPDQVSQARNGIAAAKRAGRPAKRQHELRGPRRSSKRAGHELRDGILSVARKLISSIETLPAHNPGYTSRVPSQRGRLERTGACL